MMKATREQLILTVFLILAVAAGGLVFYFANREKPVVPPKIEAPATAPVTEPETKTETNAPQQGSLGNSVEGRPIGYYIFGSGKTLLVFAGGIHGGYEANSVLLAYELIDHLEKNPDAIPENLSVAIIPALNPDGVFEVTGKEGRLAAGDIAGGSNGEGRLNANGVDLNRNFDCNWRADGIWKQKPVSGGTAAFSEPESAALKKFVLDNNPAAVVFWHSQSNAIYGSMCGGDMLGETKKIMDVYSKASGYKTVATFDGYQVTGDASDWLASIGVPAMTVELATHQTTEWEKNLAGIDALFGYYGGQASGK